MNPSPEQIQAANTRNARSSGGCMGAASAVLFCFTLGWMIWGFLGSNFSIWGASGAAQSGWPIVRIVGFWVMVAAITMAGIWTGRSVGEELLPGNPGGMVVIGGALSGLVMEFTFWLCAFGTSQWTDGGWSGWLDVLTRSIVASFYGAILAVPWGIATAVIVRNSLRPNQRPQARKRDFRHPSGGESLEE